MIAFRIAEEELDLNQDTSVQVEYYSSLFEIDRIPSMLTYPITLPWTKKNKRLLGFPGNLSMRYYRKEPFECQMYLGNLWRIGKLYIQGTSAKGISVNFQSDIGDLGDGFKNTSLRDLDLGTDQLVPQVQGLYPEANYALLTVKNEGQYGRQENPAYSGYLNFYSGGFQAPSLQHPCVPFPYLVYIMHRVMAHYGYTITGNWIESEEARRLVIFNTRALDVAHGEVKYNLHVPDLKVNEFFKAIRAAFCLGFIFNTTNRTMEIVRLHEVIADTAYTDWRQRHLQVEDWKPNNKDGFRLELTPDTGDELVKNLSPASYQTGRGKDPIKIGLDTLQYLPDQQLPAVNQEGYSTSLEAGNDKFTLRLLSYQGQEKALPLSLPDLYWQNHRDWLDFLSQTETIEAEIALTSTDLRTLRQDRKVLASEEFSTIKALWQKISVTISLQQGIQLAKAELLKVRI